MKRTLQMGAYCLAFLAVCTAVLGFLHLFTQSDSPFAYPVWEGAAVVSPSGEEAAFDPAGPLPELEEGEYYRFRTLLPGERQNGVFLLLETTGLEAAIFLDGQQLWYSASNPPGDTANQSQVQLPLPAGGGERVTIDLRPLSETAILPPLLRLSADPTDQAGNIAYGALYGFSAGAAALALVLLWGLFLVGLIQEKREWRLLLLILAAALILVNQLALRFGSYFLPQPAVRLLSGQWLGWLAALALAVYLLLHREKAFWKMLALWAAWSAGAAVVSGLTSYLWGGHLARYLGGLIAQLGQGMFQEPLYCLTMWLVLICTALSAWELVRSIARTQADARALALKNQLVMENYAALEEKLRETARFRHESAHRLTALDALVQQEDLPGLRHCIAGWKQEAEKSQIRFCEQPAVNAILQDAAGRVEKLGISFHAAVMIPKDLPIPDEDLCTLLMNLLDNAMEGAARTPEGREKAIRFQMKAAGSFLPVLCENTFDGRVETDGHGNPRTTKPDPAVHGFGIEQMRAVAEKYGSILDISWTEERFTVQTALQLLNEQTKRRES